MDARMAAVFVLLVAMACACSPEADPLPPVRLGMSARDVRERFDPGGPGAWQTQLGTGDETSLEWTGSSDARVARARFEFHLGMLVAVRATMRDAASTDRRVVTDKTVTLLRARDVTILARDCPTHRTEAEALVAHGP